MKSLESLKHGTYPQKEKKTPKLIVRLSKNSYMSGNSVIQTNKITVLKRKSDLSLLDMFDDPIEDIYGLDLNLLDEGLYEVIVINPSYDCESGMLDDWDLKLIPYKDPDSTEVRNNCISISKFLSLGFKLARGDQYTDICNRVHTIHNPVLYDDDSKLVKTGYLYHLVARATEPNSNHAHLIETKNNRWRPHIATLVKLHGEVNND
jgi:hypothetical protein